MRNRFVGNHLGNFDVSTRFLNPSQNNRDFRFRPETGRCAAALDHIIFVGIGSFRGRFPSLTVRCMVLKRRLSPLSGQPLPQASERCHRTRRTGHQIWKPWPFSERPSVADIVTPAKSMRADQGPEQFPWGTEHPRIRRKPNCPFASS